MAFPQNKSNGSPLLGMVILGLAYFALSHPAALGLHLGHTGGNAGHQGFYGSTTQGGKNTGVKSKIINMVSNPLNGTGAAAVHNVASNVTGTALNAQTTTYSGKGDDARKYVRPTCSAQAYYAAAPISPEE